MSETHLPGPLRPDVPGPAGPARTAAEGGAAKRPTAAPGAGGSPAFHVLLERLQRQAAELEQASLAADDPARLAGAVDTARASLEEAQSLGERLLEAYRAARRQGVGDEAGPSGGSEAPGAPGAPGARP